ncbi:hypothetical protein ABT126_28090 [Streptomyces sp. NPDC002012]|uniref:hypothetical protein n=2 Tax=unclassified Streptomyces TaxID=2593676 RepID=UPI00332E3CC2
MRDACTNVEADVRRRGAGPSKRRFHLMGLALVSALVVLFSFRETLRLSADTHHRVRGVAPSRRAAVAGPELRAGHRRVLLVLPYGVIS